MEDSMKPTVGRLVHYKLSELDARQINKRCNDYTKAEREEDGAQYHVGNEANAGDVVPAIVVVVWTEDSFNGQAFLDGNDTLWLTSVVRGDGEGQWDWMPFQKDQQARLAKAEEEISNNVLTPAEAVYGLMGWLTSRKEKVTLSASDEAGQAAELAERFCDANGLGSPRPITDDEDWSKILKHPSIWTK